MTTDWGTLVGVVIGGGAYAAGRVTWELLFAVRWRRWRNSVHWRRTICPHGFYYDTTPYQPACPVRCHVTRYGYGKKVKR